jgi:hypothetical protein
MSSTTLTERVQELALATARDVEGLRRDLTAVQERDRECRAAQHESWGKVNEKIGRLEVEMATLRARVAAWAAVGSILGAGLVQVVMKLLFS